MVPHSLESCIARHYIERGPTAREDLKTRNNNSGTVGRPCPQTVRRGSCEEQWGQTQSCWEVAGSVGCGKLGWWYHSLWWHLSPIGWGLRWMLNALTLWLAAIWSHSGATLEADLRAASLLYVVCCQVRLRALSLSAAHGSISPASSHRQGWFIAGWGLKILRPADIVVSSLSSLPPMQI
jgi:hypothetical protein